MEKEFSFPQYRKYTNGASFFKINSTEHFKELKKMPSGYVSYDFQVKILPDRHYISDMLTCHNGYWSEISAKEYVEIESQIK